MMPRRRPDWAMLVGSHRADSISTSVVPASQPDASPPMMPAMDLDAVRVGDHHRIVGEGVGPAVQGAQALALPRPPDGQRAGDLGGVEDVERPAAVERDVVGDVDEAVDRPQADGAQARLHPGRRRAVPDAAHQPQGEQRGEVAVGRIEGQRDLDRAGALAAHARQGLALERANAGGGEVAGDAVDRGAVRPVRRQVDLDDRIVEPGIERVGLSDRRVGRELHDAVVVVAEAELGARAQHPAALDAADRAHRQGDVLARDVGARRREDRDEVGPGVRGAADHLHGFAGAGVDGADPEPVGVRVLLGRQDPGDDVGLERGGLVLDALHLQADPRERLGDGVEGSLGVEVVLEPGEGEFHDGPSRARYRLDRRRNRIAGPSPGPEGRGSAGAAQAVRPPTRLGTSSGRKP